MTDLFLRAQQAFAAGRLEAALSDIEEVRRRTGADSTVLHLLALVERKRGRNEEARLAFEQAGALAPDDARLAADHAELLDALGEQEAALRLCDRALSAAPDLAEAAYRRALLLQRLGRLEEALAALDRLAAAHPNQAQVQTARGSVLIALERIAEAAQAFDRALALEPAAAGPLHARARIAMERGEPLAAELYAGALRRQPGDPDLILGLASALQAQGDPRGIELLAAAVQLSIGWIGGHEHLSRMRAEAGEGDSFDRSYAEALSARPDDRALHVSHWKVLASAGRHAEALTAIDRARPRLGEDRRLQLVEANIASEAGDRERADRLFERLGEDPGAASLKAWHALRCGDPAAAADLLSPLVSDDPGRISAWADLDLAWRLLGDPRHEWLSGQPGLYGASDLELDGEALARLADLLRGLHRTRAHPIGQSLRGGTQTRGRLFWRPEPEIAALREAIDHAVARHVAALSAEDPAHPLLRHRNARFAVEGSWSVRLTDGGFHVSHIHPQGILSSACYISLPGGLAAEESRNGWLELGRPPIELGVALEPLAAIEPKPGRLALFPSYLYHGTRSFAAGERLTVAFDVVVR